VLGPVALVDFYINSNAKIPINRRVADLLSNGVCRVKIACKEIFRGFKHEAQQTPSFALLRELFEV
jgi:hypothetical protein